MKNKFKIDFETVVFFVTTILTVVFGTLSNFEIFPEGSEILVILDGGFYLGLSLSVGEMLMYFPRLKSKIDDLQRCIKQEECIHFVNRERCQASMLESIRSLKKSIVTFLCYGTNRFGQQLDELVDNFNRYENNKTKIRLVICDPESPYINNEHDREQLRATIEWCVNRCENFESLYLVNTPKVYRAALVMNKKYRCLWCMLQFYNINEDPNGSLLKTFGRTPIISAGLNNNDVLHQVSNVINREYKEIKQSKNTKKVIENGEVILPVKPV